MAEKVSIVAHPERSTRSAALAEEYLRAFADATRHIAVFDEFHDVLRQLIAKDSYLLGSAELGDSVGMEEVLPDFEEAASRDTVVPVSGAEGSAGYLQYRGRRDGADLEAEDLHLMGAIAGFVAVLTAQAKKFRQREERVHVLQFLLNQLPLGVICFGARKDLIVANKRAHRLLGAAGVAHLRKTLSEQELQTGDTLRLHFEADGALLYAEGRCLEVNAELPVTTFVLHDMSGQREKMLLQLAGSVYRAESRQTHLTLAVLEDRSEAGRLLRALKASADALQLTPSEIGALDAYSCVAIFSGQQLRTVRRLLKHCLASTLNENTVKGALVSQLNQGDEHPAQSWVAAARRRMQPLDLFLRASLLVLDSYPAVIEALEWIAGELSSFRAVEGVEQTVSQIHSGAFDGLFLDLDSLAADDLTRLQQVSEQAGDSFRIFYMSHKLPSMVCAQQALAEDAFVFQKPFDAEKLRKTLALQLDFA